MPATWTEPELGVSSPARMRSSVVLPAPLRPSSAWTCPRSTCSVTSSSASLAPKARETARTSTECLSEATMLSMIEAVSPGSARRRGRFPSGGDALLGQQELRDLDRVERCALPQVVARDEEHEA